MANQSLAAGHLGSSLWPAKAGGCQSVAETWSVCDLPSSSSERPPAKVARRTQHGCAVSSRRAYLPGPVCEWFLGGSGQSQRRRHLVWNSHCLSAWDGIASPTPSSRQNSPGSTSLRGQPEHRHPQHSSSLAWPAIASFPGIWTKRCGLASRLAPGRHVSGSAGRGQGCLVWSCLQYCLLRQTTVRPCRTRLPLVQRGYHSQHLASDAAKKKSSTWPGTTKMLSCPPGICNSEQKQCNKTASVSPACS